MKTTTAIRLCAMLAVALAAAPAVAQEVTFAYDFKPGSVERHRVKLNQEADIGGMTMSHMADMQVSLKCVSGAEGKYTMEMTFDKVDVSSTMYGSATVSPMGEQLTGQVVTFDVDAGGNVSNIAPVGSFEGWDASKQLVEPLVDDWYPYLPSQAVAAGASWKKEGETKTVAGGAQTVTNSTYTFKAMKKEKGGDVAVVDVAPDTKASGTAATPAGIYAVTGGGKGKFEVLFDPAKKRVVKVKGKWNLSMNMTPQDDGDVVEAVYGSNFERELLE